MAHLFFASLLMKAVVMMYNGLNWDICSDNETSPMCIMASGILCSSKLGGNPNVDQKKNT